LITPAFLIIPMLRYLGRARTNHASKGHTAATVAASGLIISIISGLAGDATRTPAHMVIAVVSFAVLVLTRLDTLWVIGGAALAGLAHTLLAR
jgi:chromate transporter